MGLFTVLYVKEPAFVEPMPPRRIDYDHIVEVEAETLDEVFEIMNGVKSNLTQTLQVRSMSVGDILLTPSERIMLCARVGWIQVDPVAFYDVTRD